MTHKMKNLISNLKSLQAEHLREAGELQVALAKKLAETKIFVGR